MDEVKDKMKDLMKKVNPPFTSSKFKGQGRVLGSSSSSPTPSSHPLLDRVGPTTKTPPSSRIPNPNNPPPPPSDGFSPFHPLITSGKKAVEVGSFDCPVCSRSFASEDEVEDHVDACLDEGERREMGEVEMVVAGFLSGGATDAGVEVVIRLLRNVVREPENVKFRRVRMGNPKIKEAVGEVKGGVELLECVGFRLGEEDGEVWATMDVPSEEALGRIKEVVLLLEKRKGEETNTGEPASAPSSAKGEGTNIGVPASAPSSADAEVVVEKKKIDRQVRVFFVVRGSLPERIELPESFYRISAEELKREVDLRKKKLADSQLLIPKSYREKQIKASRRRYKASIIRVQFPDGVILQGVFLPLEPTTNLYEFVGSALKDPSLEFDLLQPAPHRPRVIGRLPNAGGKTPTLEDEELVPTALIKFKPIESESSVFTGLANELLEAMEPLTGSTGVSAPQMR